MPTYSIPGQSQTRDWATINPASIEPVPGSTAFRVEISAPPSSSTSAPAKLHMVASGRRSLAVTSNIDLARQQSTINGQMQTESQMPTAQKQTPAASPRPQYSAAQIAYLKKAYAPLRDDHRDKSERHRIVVAVQSGYTCITKDVIHRRANEGRYYEYNFGRDRDRDPGSCQSEWGTKYQNWTSSDIQRESCRLKSELKEHPYLQVHKTFSNILTGSEWEP